VKLPSTKENPALVIAFVRRAVTICICLAVALVVAYWIGTGQTGYLKIVAGLTIVTFVAAGLRQRAWVLIPIGWMLGGSCLWIPFHFSFRDVAVLLAACAYVSFRVLTHADVRRSIHILDCILTLIVINTIIDFVHHPVGLQVFGSQVIGGRGYVNVVLAVLAYRVIVRLPDSIRPVSWIPYFILAGTAVVTMFNIIVYVAPSTTPYVYMLYGAVDYSEYARSPLAVSPVTRVLGLRDFGYTLVLVLCALYPPKTLLNPLRVRFYLLIVGFVLVLISGFRSTLGGILAAVAISSLLHQGWRGVLTTFLAGGLVLGTVTFGQGRLYELPPGVQRAFSFLPGRWSPLVVTDAERSSQMRFDWWRQIVKEGVIKDWVFGDGMGVAEKEFENLSSRTTFLEWYQLTGGFHNGPLTTIRFAGLIGLVLFYTFMITAAIYAVKCARLCRGTSLEPAAIFLAIQLIWIPIYYTFVFGAYDQDLPQEVFLVALLLLLLRMIPQARAAATEPRLPQPMPPPPAAVPALR
jgi:hypothetical protein